MHIYAFYANKIKIINYFPSTIKSNKNMYQCFFLLFLLYIVDELCSQRKVFFMVHAHPQLNGTRGIRTRNSVTIIVKLCRRSVSNAKRLDIDF